MEIPDVGAAHNAFDNLPDIEAQIEQHAPGAIDAYRLARTLGGEGATGHSLRYLVAEGSRRVADQAVNLARNFANVEELNLLRTFGDVRAAAAPPRRRRPPPANRYTVAQPARLLRKIAPGYEQSPSPKMSERRIVKAAPKKKAAKQPKPKPQITVIQQAPPVSRIPVIHRNAPMSMRSTRDETFAENTEKVMQLAVAKDPIALANSALDGTRMELAITPALLGGAISQLAQSFQEFRFEEVHFLFKPRVGTDARGVFTMAYLADPNTPAPVSGELATLRHACQTPLFRECSLRVPVANKFKLNRNGQRLGNPKKYSLGSLLFDLPVHTTELSEGTVFGELWVKYKLRFRSPVADKGLWSGPTGLTAGYSWFTIALEQFTAFTQALAAATTTEFEFRASGAPTYNGIGGSPAALGNEVVNSPLYWRASLPKGRWLLNVSGQVTGPADLQGRVGFRYLYQSAGSSEKSVYVGHTKAGGSAEVTYDIDGMYQVDFTESVWVWPVVTLRSTAGGNVEVPSDFGGALPDVAAQFICRALE